MDYLDTDSLIKNFNELLKEEGTLPSIELEKLKT